MWVSGGLPQILWLVANRPDESLSLDYRRQALKLSDGGEMNVDWCGEFDAPGTLKVIIVFPGIGGDSSRGYIKYFVQHMTQQSDSQVNYVVGVLQGRGVGDT